MNDTLNFNSTILSAEVGKKRQLTTLFGPKRQFTEQAKMT